MTSTIAQQAGDKAVQFGQIGQVETITIDQHQTIDARKTIYVNCDVGALVESARAQSPQWRSRPTPILLQPSKFEGLLDRQTVMQAAHTAIAQAQPWEVYGSAGIGKTVLLRHLAYDPAILSQFPDGVIYLSGRDRQGDDLLQPLFEAFYESSAALKPQSNLDFRHALQGKRALVLLDDAALSAEAVDQFLQAVPSLTVLLASRQQRFWEAGRSVFLPGLPLAESLTLVERDLQRPLTKVEQQAIAALWEVLDGNPLSLLQVVSKAKSDGRSLVAVGFPALVRQILSFLTQPQRLILAALGALGGLALLAEQVAAMTEIPALEQELADLRARHLVQKDGDRYTVARNLLEVLQQEWNLNAWLDRALISLSEWASQHRQDPQQLLQTIESFTHLLEWGVEQQRWVEVLQLAKAIGPALVLARRWQLWQQVLVWGLQAAQGLGDRSAEALMLHELGTRALCLDDWATAETYLNQALLLRKSLGDQAGLEVTQHNLQYLWALMRSPNSELSADSSPVLPILTGVIFALFFGLGGWLWWLEQQPQLIPAIAINPSLFSEPSPPSSPTPPSPSATPSPSPTPTPEGSNSPTVSPALESPNTPTASPTTSTPPETSPPETSPPSSSPETSTPPSPDEETPPTPQIVLAQFVLQPDTIPAGETARGIVMLKDLAIADTVITLSSDRPELVTVPPEVIVPTGKAQVTFVINTQSPESSIPIVTRKISSTEMLAQVNIPAVKVNIQATDGTVTLTQVLTVQPANPPSPSIPPVLRSPFRYPILRSPLSRE